MAYATWVAETHRPVKGGGSTRAHLEAAAKMGSPSAKAMLTPPPLPRLFAHLWQWWTELNAGRSSGGMGIGSITWESLDAWARRTRANPTSYETRLLMRLDSTFRHAIAEPA